MRGGSLNTALALLTVTWCAGTANAQTTMQDVMKWTKTAFGKLQLAVHRAWADVQRSGVGAAERGHDGEHARRDYGAADGRAGGGGCVHVVRHGQ